MIPKIIRASSFAFDDPVVKLMEVHSKGIDKGWMSKRAAAFDDILADIKPQKGRSFLHVITVGSMETYGANTNSDAFNRRAGEFRVPFPKKGGKSVIVMDGGLEKYHKLYPKNGKVYKNHKDNKDPSKSSGDIVHETINDDLDRGELIISVDNNVWGNEIENLANDRPVFLSQGCGVRSDICSICGYRRTSFDDSCEHVSKYKLVITPEGHQVFVVNDAPRFHDISGVVVPADKIVFALRKGASAEDLTSAELAIQEGYTIPVELHIHGKRAADRLGMLQKMAAMEKEILMAGQDPCVEAFSKGAGFGHIDESTAKLITDNTDNSLDILKDIKVVLPVELFMKLLARGSGEDKALKEVLPAVKDRMPTLFSDILGDQGCLDSVLSDGTYEGRPGGGLGLRRALSGLVPSHSMECGPVSRRVTLRIIGFPGEGLPAVKRLEKRSSEELGENRAADYLAREYGKYLLSAGCGCQDGFAERMVVLQKFA